MIFTGSTADGSDMAIAEGVYMSPCGNYWSNMPYTRADKAYQKVYQHCVRYRKSFDELYNQVKAGSSENLPKWVRKWLLEQDNGLIDDETV